MPTYDYECQACRHIWDASQKISEEPQKTCPKCEEDKAKRLVTTRGGFMLSGSGWFNKGGY
jgi:putative FmdB family regulatory protein